MIDLSILIPVYNEEFNLKELYNKLIYVLSKINKSYEIIFIDDGSTDGSFNILKELNKKDQRVKIIKFRRNFGQSSALNIGFKNNKGKIIITMDADLQNDPEDILHLIEKIEEGYDVVCGWRHNRKDSFSKRIISKLANLLRRILIKEKIHDAGCTLRAYKKEAIENLDLYGENHRYIASLIAFKGLSITEIKVKHHKRLKGKTKYGFERLLNGFLDLLYIKFWGDYSQRPLHFFGKLGILQITIGTIATLYKLVDGIIRYFNNEKVLVGPVLLISVFLIVMGILFIIFGFLAEIEIRNYYSSKKDVEIEQTIGF